MTEHPVITDRDRRDASAVTVSGSGYIFEIQLGHMCNNRCVFCSSGMLTEEGLAKPVPLADVFAAIEHAKANGARRLIFLGGEPTLHRGFLPSLARAVEVGFTDIVIFTNGVTLPQPGFIDKVVALGTFEWRISIQGADEASHVAVTKREHSYSRIMTGLAELARRGQRVTMNMCVNAHSYQSLPAYPDLVREHGIAQVHVDIIRPASTGRRSLLYFQDIMPRYTVMAPYLEQMLEGFEVAALDVEVSVGNLPHCVLRRWPRAVFHGGEDTVTVASDDRGLEPGVDKYAWHAAMRRHIPACEGCVLRGDCTGVFETYLEVHGADEFAPITEAELLLLDPARRPFLTLARRSLADLLARAEQPPAGWILDQRVEDRDLRILALTYLRGRDRATLRWETPERSGAGAWADDGAPLVARTEVMNLALVVDPSLDDGEVDGLLSWALGADAAKTVGERWRRLRSYARLRVQAARTLSRLQAGPSPAGWRWVASRPELGADVDRPELGLRLAHTGALGILDVVLRLSTDPSQRPIELEFRRGPETDDAAAERATASVVAELRRATP